MLREYVIGEAMHALGIPTTRALAVVATGEHVVRETVLPGAVLDARRGEPPPRRHVPVRGRAGDPALLRRLADYAIARHHPRRPRRTTRTSRSSSASSTRRRR